MVANTSLLYTFKYYDFFAVSFQEFSENFGLTIQPYLLDVALPIGISLYTFQTISCTIDVYRGKVKPARNILDFGLYVAYFPQLVTGPIVLGTRFPPLILKPRSVSCNDFLVGANIFLWRLFLKVVVADNLAAIVDPAY
jgi:D-alanyl-lipoteichoic acid acyltransferase DltB (MBOAT superfamily)